MSDLARLEVELHEERNPAITDRLVAEATLWLKGVTLRAQDASPEMSHSIIGCSEQLARQVKRHREKRRKRREGRGQPALGGDAAAALTHGATKSCTTRLAACAAPRRKPLLG